LLDDLIPHFYVGHVFIVIDSNIENSILLFLYCML
jgi:hypothetical protein